VRPRHLGGDSVLDGCPWLTYSTIMTARMTSVLACARLWSAERSKFIKAMSENSDPPAR
jgi:hypothetical protein